MFFCRILRSCQNRSIFLFYRRDCRTTVGFKHYCSNIIPLRIQCQISRFILYLPFRYHICAVFKPSAKCIPFFCRFLQFNAVFYCILCRIGPIIFSVIQNICDRIYLFFPFRVKLQVSYATFFNRSVDRSRKFCITVPPRKFITFLRWRSERECFRIHIVTVGVTVNCSFYIKIAY